MGGMAILGGVLDSQSAKIGDPTKLAELLEFALWAQRGSPFWIGDLVVLGDTVFGDEFYQSLGSDWSIDMINRYMGVARLVPPDNRVDGLSWSHHSYVARVPQDRQRELLEHAKANGLTSTQFRAYIAERRQEWASDSVPKK